MNNPNTYIQPPVSEINITRRNGNHVATRKAKRSEVPPMYRKNILKSVLKGIALTVFALVMLNCILFFATVL